MAHKELRSTEVMNKAYSLGMNSSKTIKRTQNMLIETDPEMHRFDKNI